MTPRERRSIRTAWTVRFALVLLAGSFGWYSWHAYELARSRLCYEAGGFPNVRGFCEAPTVEFQIVQPAPVNPNGPVL